MIKGVIDQLEEWADLLEATRGDKAPVDSHDILRGVDPTLAVQKKHQPKGTDASDFWVLKYGDPLAVTDAAMALAYKIEPEAEFEMKIKGTGNDKVAHVIMRKKGPKGYKTEGRAQHLCWAVTVAAMQYHRRIANDI